MATSQNGRIKVTVGKESETQILSLQANLALLCGKYQVALQQVSDDSSQGSSHKIVELGRLQSQIRTLDRLMKEEIRKGTLAPGSSSSSSSEKILSSKPIISRPPVEIIHPSSQVEKEEFFNVLGLMSHEALRLRQLQTGKVERRRRTANTNPKYSSNGFIKFDEQSTRRSKRLEEAATVSSDPNVNCPLEPSPIPAYMTVPSCFVCYGTDYDLSCETCTTKFHSNCIRVTGSNAPVPHRLPICPKCVQAANTSQRVRILNRSSRPPPSIMQSPANLREEADLDNIKIEDDLVDETENDEEEEILDAKPSPSSSNRNAKARRSNSTSDVEKQSPVKSNANTFRNFGSSKKQIEAVSPKAKVCNGGGGQGRAVRIARVRLNMRRSSEEPKSGSSGTATATSTVASPTTSTVTRSCNKQEPEESSPQQSEIRWQNKLKPKPLRTYARKRLPVPEVSSVGGQPTHICGAATCDLCVVHGCTVHVEKRRNLIHGEENEENALFRSHQAVALGNCPTIKTEKVNGSEQQSPLVIKNNNDVNLGDQSFSGNHNAVEVGLHTPVKNAIDVGLHTPVKNAIDVGLHTPVKNAIDVGLHTPVKNAIDVGLHTPVKNALDVGLHTPVKNALDFGLHTPVKLSGAGSNSNSPNRKGRKATIMKRELQFNSPDFPLDSNGLDARNNQIIDGDGPQGKKMHQRGDRAQKTKLAKAENAIVIRNTIIAMSAAAATVMSNPLQPTIAEEEYQDPWANDTIMQTISSVIAWSSSDNEMIPVSTLPLPLMVPDIIDAVASDIASTHPLVTGNDPHLTMMMPMTMMEMSPSTMKQDMELEDVDKVVAEAVTEIEEYTQQMMPPDNLSIHGLSINGEMDILSRTSEEYDDKSMSYSYSMTGQLSDDDEALSPNSPAPSWAQDEMSRSELVEKMLLVDEDVEMAAQQQPELNQSVVNNCAITMTESKS